MLPTGAQNVTDALGLALYEVDELLRGLEERGKAAFDQGQYREAKDIATLSQRCTAFRSRLQALLDEWVALGEKPRSSGSPSRRSGRSSVGGALRQEAYRLPILRALVRLGGRGPAGRVLELVHEEMKDRLTEADYAKLSSGTIRWKNRAQWMRYHLKEEGLLRDDSPSGIWEISAEGRRWLEEQDGTV